MTDTQTPDDPFAGGVNFPLDFGPTVRRITVGDLDTGRVLGIPDIPAREHMWATVFFSKELAESDDLDELTKLATYEVTDLVRDVAAEIQTPEYVDILTRHVLTALATYRGTVLKKGITNRATRRRDNRTPDQKIQRALYDTQAPAPDIGEGEV